MHKQQKLFGWSEYYRIFHALITLIDSREKFDTGYHFQKWTWMMCARAVFLFACTGTHTTCCLQLHCSHTHISHTLRDCSKSIILSITEMLSIEKHHQPVKKWIPIICKHKFRFHRLACMAITFWTLVNFRATTIKILTPSWHNADIGWHCFETFLSLARQSYYWKENNIHETNSIFFCVFCHFKHLPIL